MRVWLRTTIRVCCLIFLFYCGTARASIEGNAGVSAPGLASEGAWYAGKSTHWTMYATDNPSADLRGVTTLANPVPEYHWWNGCSPTAAGMLFSYWDTYLDKPNLYPGDASVWDKLNMDMTNSDHYDGTHGMVASWGHYQAGRDKGLTYGSYDRPRFEWDSLADFMRTEDGGTWRSNMAQGFIDYALWDNPETSVSESYRATSITNWNPDWDSYKAEIEAGRPVHVGIHGHSILGFGFWEGTTPWHTEDTQFVVNWTTWGDGWSGKWGLIEFSDVYAWTTLEVGDWNGAVPEPTSLAIWSIIAVGGLGLAHRHRRRKQDG